MPRNKCTPLPTILSPVDLPDLFANFCRGRVQTIRDKLDNTISIESSSPYSCDTEFRRQPLAAFEPVSMDLVRTIVMKSAPKLCELHRIPTSLLFECLDPILPLLTAVINTSLSSGIVNKHQYNCGCDDLNIPRNIRVKDYKSNTLTMTRRECRQSLSAPTSKESDAGMSNQRNQSECNEIPHLKTCPGCGNLRAGQYRSSSQEALDTGHHCHPSLHGLVNGHCSNVLEFFQNIPQDVRKCLVEFLSSGVTGDLEIHEENFHHFFHVANHLNLRRLLQCCVEVYQKGDKTRIKETIGTCECVHFLEQLVATAYRRETSVLFHEQDSDSGRNFQVLFLTKDKHARKQPIVVTDFARDFKIYKQDIANVKRVGVGFAACAFEQQDCPYIFVSGGEEKKNNQIWQYDVILDKWSKAGKMLHGRSRHIMVAVKDKIYLIGGQNIACIEEFDPINGKCFEIGSLAVAAWSSAHAVYNDTIYIFGGKNHAGRISTVQSFNCETNRLARLEDLPCACSGSQAVVLGDIIYIATTEGHMIRFKPADGSSELCALQPCARRHFVMFVRNERIYITGGVRPSGEVRGDKSHLYKYSPEADIWSDVATLSTSLPVYTCCTVRFSRTCGIVPFVKFRSIR